MPTEPPAAPPVVDRIGGADSVSPARSWGRCWCTAAFGAGIVSFFPFRRRFCKYPNGKPTPVQDAPPPEPVPSAKRARLIPPGSTTPPGELALLLRFAPDTAAVQQLAVTVQTASTAPGLVPYYSNGFEDWLATPEVTVDSETLPARWGTWLVPLAPGPHTVRVRLPDPAAPMPPRRVRRPSRRSR